MERTFMDILVLFKMVPNLEDLTEADWAVGENLRPVDTYARPIINPEDESALELALRLRDAFKNRVSSLTAATFDDSPGARRMAKTLKALGYSRVLLTPVDFDTRFCPDWIARAALEKTGRNYSLILTGSRSADGQNGLTAMYLAERLGLPLITEVLNLSPHDGDSTLIKVESLSDDGLLVQTASPPMVLSIGNAPSAILRVPTIKDRLKSAQEPLEIGTPLSISGGAPTALPPGVAHTNPPPGGATTTVKPGVAHTTLQALWREKQSRVAKVVDAGSPADKAATLLASLQDWGL